MTNDLAWMRPKLAELCGVKLNATLWPERNIWAQEDHCDYWRPDEDVAQAIRCLEAWRDKCNGDWEIRSKIVAGEPAYYLTLDPFWEGPGDKVMRLFDGPLSHAICLAIAAALGWQKP